MNERITLFVDVIVPLAVHNMFTYRVPDELKEEIKPGQRVVIQFGKNKLFSALVRKVHQNPPLQYKAKYLEAILDVAPIVNEHQFKLWEWIAGYYLCTVGEVMNAALPSGLKLSSETKFIRNTSTQPDATLLTDHEFLICDALDVRAVLTTDDISAITGKKSVHKIIKSLIDKGLIYVQEELKEKFKPKFQTFVKLAEYADDEARLKEIMDALEKRAFKQLEVLMAYFKLSGKYTESSKPVTKNDLLKFADADDQVLKSLVSKNVLEIYQEEVGRLGEIITDIKNRELTEYQLKAYLDIQEQFKQKDVVLLHGVTSSGKTEVFVKLIEDALAQGKQVLYLLPEIALTTQIINRLHKYFGNAVGVYHSKFNAHERVEIWNSLSIPATGNEVSAKLPGAHFNIILGARSALFLPFTNLGLVIVDEEHDASYKQYDPPPRYNARDSAIYLAALHRAKVLLGSATPAVETYYNTQEKKFGLVELTKRYGGVQLPEILIADVKEARKQKLMKSHFSPLLLESIETAFKNKEQVILFQNRRGFAPMLVCETCAWSPQCVNCDVTLTYHKSTNQLRCHYCGYTAKSPTACGACGGVRIKFSGFGTEKVEEELALFFPKARIARMDLDTTRSKFAYQQIISDFETRNVDVLVGTQMVTKGLDFDNVSTVGILNADSMLGFPDFRAFERSFQLLTQVSGRAGRSSKRGKVIIQTYNPYHPIITQVLSNNYSEMYQNQLLERRNFHYPPFYRLIELTLSHKELEQLEFSAKYLSGILREKFGERIIGPAFPMVARVRNLYLKKIIIKIEREVSIAKAKTIIREYIDVLKASNEHKQIKIAIDIDPL